MEHKSLVNSAEGFMVKRWEIQPYVGKEEMVVDYGSPVLHNELTRVLKRMVSESLSEMKPSERNGYEIVLASDAAILNRGLRRGRPSRSTLIKELAISFEIPNYCIAKNIDMDKVAISYRNSSGPHVKGKLISGPQFSFKERLEGWNIHCTQRPNNTCDMFYRHTKANQSFRSMVEAVRFMLYEIYPNCRKENKAMVPVVPQGKHMLVAEASSPMLRSKEENKEMSYELVVKDSCYTNVMNSESNKEDNKVLPDVSEYQEGLEGEKVKDMIETLFDVLPDVSTRDKRMMNIIEDGQRRNGVKRARTESGGSEINMQSPEYLEKENKKEVEDGEVDDDELSAAEVLLKLKSATSDELKHIPVSISLHQLAHVVLKIMDRRQECRCKLA